MRWLLSSAVLLAIGMVVAGALAGRTLRERDAAVRAGVLLRSAHDVERELREAGPESAERTLRSLVEGGSASAAELLAADRVIARAGAPSGDPIESPLFLGPSWRDLAGMGGMRPGSGSGRRQSPFVLKVWPAAGVGDSSGIAALTTWGSLLAALALLAFAVVGARGIRAGQRASAAEAERQRLEAISAAGAGLAHRIRNPLATIKATAQILEARTEDSLRERATRIVDASGRIELLVDELLRFARPVETRAEPIELGEVARSVCPDASSSGSLVVRADREHVLAALEELVVNARNAGDPHPQVVVRREGHHALIEVRDRGAGLTVEPARAFEPYVTSRPDGTGLGLPTVRSLVRANGGDVLLTSREGGGCVATIVLPAVQP